MVIIKIMTLHGQKCQTLQKHGEEIIKAPSIPPSFTFLTSRLWVIGPPWMSPLPLSPTTPTSEQRNRRQSGKNLGAMCLVGNKVASDGGQRRGVHNREARVPSMKCANFTLLLTSEPKKEKGRRGRPAGSPDTVSAGKNPRGCRGGTTLAEKPTWSSRQL